jgi:hypothetical protein
MQIRWKTVAFVVVCIGATVCLRFDRANLGDPLPLALTVIVSGCGMLLAYFIAAETAALHPAKRGIRLVLSGAIVALISAFMAVFVTQSLVLRIAFIGILSKPELIAVEVEDRRLGKRSNYLVEVRLPGARRDFPIPVSKEVFQKVGPKVVPGEHCILLPVETGRWGIRRVWAPNDHDTPLALSDYRPCYDTSEP